MQKFNILKFAAIALVLGGSFYSCKEEEETEWREISFREYSLADTYCQWNNLNYDGKVIIINSQKDLKKYITCTEGSYPEIDFSKNTLLLTSFGGGDIMRWEISLSQNSTNKYILKVVAHRSFAAAVLGWNIAILTSKISNKSTIQLDVEETLLTIN